MGVLELSGPVITVFGSALPAEGEPAYALARELGRALAGAGLTLCNGGYGGTMEAGARGVRESGGRTIGVTCDLFAGRTPNPWIDDHRRAATLFDRLDLLVRLGDAYVVLPGGTGTLLELAAVLELTGKGLVRPRPIVLLGSYWADVLRRMDPPPHVSMTADVRACIDHLARHLLGGTRE